MVKLFGTLTPRGLLSQAVGAVYDRAIARLNDLRGHRPRLHLSDCHRRDRRASAALDLQGLNNKSKLIDAPGGKVPELHVLD
jgi:hypothetical protein